jgi:hypothetical protein
VLLLSRPLASDAVNVERMKIAGYFYTSYA